MQCPPEFGWKLILMSSISYEFLVISLQISWRSTHLYKPRQPWLRRAWILLPFLISIVRELMHWNHSTASWLCITMRTTLTYFWIVWLKQPAGILLFDAISDNCLLCWRQTVLDFVCVTKLCKYLCRTRGQGPNIVEIKAIKCLP